MATIKCFEDLEIWQSARALNVKLIPIIEKLKDEKCYKLKEQLDGSAGSVMDNIAEGFERNGNREFVQFLSIAKASLGESRSQLYRVLDRNYLDEQIHDSLQEECLILADKIGRFITYLNNSSHRGTKFNTNNNKSIPIE